MTTFQDNVCIARVRLLALRAQVSAGGEPRAEQIIRSIEPVCGDLLPLPASAAADPEARAAAAAALAKWQAIDRVLTHVVSPPGPTRRAAAVAPPGRR